MVANLIVEVNGNVLERFVICNPETVPLFFRAFKINVSDIVAVKSIVANECDACRNNNCRKILGTYKRACVELFRCVGNNENGACVGTTV